MKLYYIIEIMFKIVLPQSTATFIHLFWTIDLSLLLDRVFGPTFSQPTCLRGAGAGRQHLPSARCHQLSVPRVRRSTFGARTFSVAGTRVWNSLLDHLRDPIRRDLKTCSLDIRSVCALEVLRNGALQIDIYLLTIRDSEFIMLEFRRLMKTR